MNIYFGHKSIDFDDCEILNNRNFEGREVIRNGRTVNSKGRRNFLIAISPEQYEELIEKGWDVGQFAPREDGDEATCFIRVNLSYFKAPPKVHYISEGQDTMLTEEQVSILDHVNFERVDIRCSEVNKQKQDGTWVKKPFVMELWATVTPDRFRNRYEYLNHSEEEDLHDMSGDDSDLPFKA